MRFPRSRRFPLNVCFGFGMILFLFASNHLPSAHADSPNPLPSTPLSEPRTGLAGAAAGGLVLFAGGKTDTGEYSATVDVFDTSTQSWLTPTTISVGRYQLVGAAAGGLILFAGGELSSGAYSAVVDVYDTSTREWITATATISLSQARTKLAGVAAGNLIFFAGGQTSLTTPSAVVDVYDASLRNWLTPANLSKARTDVVGATAGNLVLFAGGDESGKGTFSTVVDIYDISTRTWLPTSSLSQPRRSLAAAASGNLVLFAGGRPGALAVSPVVDVFDTSTQNWLPSANLSEARCFLTAVAAGNLVFFSGGLTANLSASAKIDVYDTSTQSWLPSPPSLSMARGLMAGAATKGLVLFAGGDEGLGVKNMIHLTPFIFLAHVLQWHFLP